MADVDLLERLRTELPRLLREHPEVRHELWGLMLEAFPSRQEFLDLLQEVRASREDSNRRFEELRTDLDRRFAEAREDLDRRFAEAREDLDRRFAEAHADMDRRFAELRGEMDRRFAEAREDMDRRFAEAREDMDRRFAEVHADMDRRFAELRGEMDRRFAEVHADMDRRFTEAREDMERRSQAMDRRFDGVIAELREQRVHLSALGGRVGRGLEHLVQGVVEEFAGQTFPSAERLTLVDQQGEVFGVPGAQIEFDLYAHDGSAYLVEVKSHLKSSDVLQFHRKAAFAEARLGRSVTRLILALSMEPDLEDLMRRLNIQHRIRAIMP